MRGRVEPHLHLGELQRALRLRTRMLQLSAMDRDPGARQVVRRLLEAVLGHDVQRTSGLVRPELPAPCPELDPRQRPEHVCGVELVSLRPRGVRVLEQRPRALVLVAPHERICGDERCRLDHRASPTTPASSRARAVYSAAPASPTVAVRSATDRSARARSPSSPSRSAISSAACACTSAPRNPARKRVAEARRTSSAFVIGRRGAADDGSPDDADWLVLLNEDGNRVLTIQQKSGHYPAHLACRRRADSNAYGFQGIDG